MKRRCLSTLILRSSPVEAPCAADHTTGEAACFCRNIRLLIRGDRESPLPIPHPPVQRCTSALADCCVSRRSMLTCSICMTGFFLVDGSCKARNNPVDNLEFSTAPSGLQWADAKTGSGSPAEAGNKVAIDFVMSTTGARYGSKIWSTKDRDTPYRWTLGDGSTIPGLEQAVAGGDGVPPMLPGGVRRVIIPPKLAYEGLARKTPGLQIEECSGGYGPIPPRDVKRGDVGEAEFQRFKNIYCNSNRAYQPDLVMDIKLFNPKRD
eukprot:gnl/TRDRNA2_/TRDRNA2_133307_c0_seq3.p1 gnl/TRDRNA2_/TRDRNA2_133307_c0~~gnl/TRDRNA2_/TRDRNA2_133307_c0_seq3.p1  ORF type:complete len:264 (+),score=19.99 gnl/TRDRNA2_/TRDRNA2_133307_c0_seq3:202-993(+)